MAHTHSHAHGSTKNIAFAFFLNVGFTIFELIGGFYVNSVSIISDALHDFGDSLSLGLSWYLQKKSEQGANQRFTFGYKRFSLLGALVNSLVLVLGSAFVIYQAVQRIIEPEHTDAKGMLVFAIIGVLVNGIAALRLRKGQSMNEKVLSWHLVEDVLGWVAILITSIVIMIKDIHVLDPILSLSIALFILWNVFRRLKETMYVFLQGAPKDIDLSNLNQKIERIQHVVSTHHTHMWTLDEENQVFTVHITVDRQVGIPEVIEVKNKVKELLNGQNVSHATIDIEFQDEACFMEGNSH